MQKKSESVAHTQDGIKRKKLKNSRPLRNSPPTGTESGNSSVRSVLRDSIVRQFYSSGMLCISEKPTTQTLFKTNNQDVRRGRIFRTMDIGWMIVIVIVSGAVGGFVNVFIGDSGLHLPKVENGVFQAGFLGTVIVGALAALGSWGAAKAIVIFGAPAGTAVTF